MAFRVLFLENQMNMKVKLDNLVFVRDEDEIRIPVRDVSLIVIDNLMMNISTRTLCLLAQKNVGVILCDQQHLPIGYFSSYDNHSRMSKKLKIQVENSKEFYDLIWKNTITAKLKNQANVLSLLGKDSVVIDNITTFAESVLPGDPTNREAHAAKIYFNELMENTFSRGNPDILLNSGLDYTYTIIRSYIARLCVGYGLNTQLGIHHKNEYNRFNLSDDLIEPVRPIIDYYVYNLLKDEEYLTSEHRKAMVNLLNHKISYKGKRMYFCNMLEEYISSFAQFIEEKETTIVFPEVINYLGEEYEV